MLVMWVRRLFLLYYFQKNLESSAIPLTDVYMFKIFIGSAFMFGRCLTSILWGIVADRYGRKPVLVIGIITV